LILIGQAAVKNTHVTTSACVFINPLFTVFLLTALVFLIIKVLIETYIYFFLLSTG